MIQRKEDVLPLTGVNANGLTMQPEIPHIVTQVRKPTKREIEESKREADMIRERKKEMDMAERWREYTLSESFCKVNAWSLIAKACAYTAMVMAGQIEDELTDQGFLFGSLKSKLESFARSGDAYYKKFNSNVGGTAENKRLTDAIDIELNRWMEDMERQLVKDGMAFAKGIKTRRETGKGCDTCRKFMTEHCLVTQEAVYGSKEELEAMFSCYGHQKREEA